MVYRAHYLDLHRHDSSIYRFEDYLTLNWKIGQFLVKFAINARLQENFKFDSSSFRMRYFPNLNQPDGVFQRFSSGFFDQWDRPPGILLDACHVSASEGLALEYFVPSVAYSDICSAIAVDAYGCIEIEPLTE
ncbi:MAG: hypothetical protein ACK5PB_19100 [Pirellula sp.]|jgi:hypothetical protein